MRALWLLFLSLFTTQPSLSPLGMPKLPTKAATPTPVSVTFGLVGDLGLGRHITSTARAKNDFSWSFQGISPWLTQNDFTLANLESPIIVSCPYGPTGTFTFCGDTRFLPHLQSFVFNLNNNHILNYGLDGLNQTKNLLDSNTIPHVYDKPLIFTQNDIKFGLLGYDFITYPKLFQAEILQAVKDLRPRVDWLIVSLHWGNEYLPQPEAWRVKFAHDLIDAGVDLIHGHHPHVWQEPEIYKGKPIFYSFGNFIFDQSWSHETSHSQIARFTLKSDFTYNYDLFPVEIRFNSQPHLMEQ